jgi:diacylglycerol kinase family enzyme
MQAELIYNAHAGGCNIRRELGFVTDYLTQRDWTVVVRETRGPLDATRLTRRAVERGVDVVIAAGGDGTLNEVVTGLVGTQVALGVLPVGTTNVWALQMRIPALSPMAPGTGLAKWVVDLEERMDYTLPAHLYRSVLLDAAKVLVEGETRPVDIGQVNDRYFLLWAGVGLDAEVTLSVSPEDKKAFGPWAFVGTALDVLRDYKSSKVVLALDGHVTWVEASLIVISNIKLYAGLLSIGAHARVDDGKLDVCIFKGEGLFNYAQHILKIATGMHLQDTQIEYHQAAEIFIESDAPLPVHVDDEPFTKTPVTVRVLPGAIRAILPHDVPQGLFGD